MCIILRTIILSDISRMRIMEKSYIFILCFNLKEKKMLAEVRALKEGIIIADQLPTAMAPEVIKNTGLKIVHRLTSQDDRSLVGSTMSASGTQIEELATYMPGNALISYEGLLKPFRMQIKAFALKDTPSTEQLFDLIIGDQVTLKQMNLSIYALYLSERISAIENVVQSNEKIISDMTVIKMKQNPRINNYISTITNILLEVIEEWINNKMSCDIYG